MDSEFSVKMLFLGCMFHNRLALVPMLCVGMQFVTLQRHGPQERSSMNSHAERGNYYFLYSSIHC